MLKTIGEKLLSWFGGRAGMSFVIGLIIYLFPIIAAAIGYPLLPGYDVAAKTIAEGIWFLIGYYIQKRFPRQGALFTGTGATSVAGALTLIATGTAQAFGANIPPDVVNKVIAFFMTVIGFFAQRRLKTAAVENKKAAELQNSVAKIKEIKKLKGNSKILPDSTTE